VRSPFSHGVKITPPAPRGAPAASASMRAYTSAGTGVSRSASSGYKMLSRSQLMQAPADSCSLAT
jgi:hypothetical protein